MSLANYYAGRYPASNNPQSPFFVDEEEREAEQEIQDRLDDERRGGQRDERGKE